jgi:hypothetical protein
MTKLRITPDGRICGLWSDDVRLTELGVVRVRRASHVEFDIELQRWTVRPATTGGPIPRWLVQLLKRPPSCIVHHAQSRAHALAWEHENFQPGGPFWPQLTHRFSDPSDRSPSHF